ncbi:MAG: hypothetical protein WAW13_02685 [Minisyncoccia bacterium]
MGNESITTKHSPETSAERGVQAIYERVRKILENGSLDPKNFIDLYGESNVARDLQTVTRLKAGFERDEAKHMAEVLEAIIYEQITQSEWLGPNAETIRPSEYDDFVNGVDLIVEFDDTESSRHLALGVDITFGSDTMRKKFTRIRNEIHEDKLAEVKYFESHGFKGSLKQLPRVVIGVEIDTIVELAGLWIHGSKKELATHFIKNIISEEIERQLRTFLAYARSINSVNAIRSYTSALSTLEKVRVGSDSTGMDQNKNESIDKDRVYQEIRKQLEDFRVTSR